MSQTKNVDVVCVVPNAKGEALQAVGRELKKKGLKVNSVLESGLVLGSVDPNKIDNLKSVAGVSYVRPQGEVHIASI
jgi:hypothetical protein